MSQDAGLIENNWDCVSRMYHIGIGHRWLHKGK